MVKTALHKTGCVKALCWLGDIASMGGFERYGLSRRIKREAFEEEAR